MFKKQNTLNIQGTKQTVVILSHNVVTFTHSEHSSMFQELILSLISPLWAMWQVFWFLLNSLVFFGSKLFLFSWKWKFGLLLLCLLCYVYYLIPDLFLFQTSMKVYKTVKLYIIKHVLYYQSWILPGYGRKMSFLNSKISWYFLMMSWYSVNLKSGLNIIGGSFLGLAIWTKLYIQIDFKMHH